MKKKLDQLEEDALLIVMAYPETLVPACYKMWYNIPLTKLGFIQQGKICAGHSTIILIGKKNKSISYADFGRYITPYGKGRVRMQETDPELVIPIIPNFDKQGELLNLKEILLFLEAHPEKTHGDGPLLASICTKVNYKRARSFIEKSCYAGSLPYGPFDLKGTNCSRFVADVVKKSCTDSSIRRKLRFTRSISPSPLGNVYKSNTEKFIYEVFKGKIQEHVQGSYLSRVFEKLMPSYLRKALARSNNIAAPKPKNMLQEVPKHAQWLTGTGTGAWFVIDERESNNKTDFILRRFTLEGELIFEKCFQLAGNQELDISRKYKIIHDTNAKWCTLIQNDKNLTMNYVGECDTKEFKGKPSHSTSLFQS